MRKLFVLLFSMLFFVLYSSAQEARIKVACVGNSITFGAGIKDRDNHSYPVILGRMLGDDYEVNNFGFSARTLLNKGDHPYMKEQMFQDALNFLPNVVVIKLGTNDTKPQNWQFKKEYPIDMETMVNAFRSLASHPKVYLCYPAKAYAVEWGISDSVIVNEVIPMIDKVAQKMQLNVIDLHTPTTGMRALFPDNIHPNPKGAAVLACEVYKAITNRKVGAKVLFIGDSITDGNWGGSGGKSSAARNHWDQNHILGSGYMYLSAAHYMALYPERDYAFVNRGISGNTLADLEKRWRVDVINEKPDVLSILIGTNDVDQFLRSGQQNFDFAAWEHRYRSLIESSLKENARLKVVLCSPFVFNSGTLSRQSNFVLRDSLVRQIVKVVKKIASDYHATFLDYQQLFDDLYYKYPAISDNYWIWDGIHPTPAGHEKMSELWIRRVGDF